MYLQFWLRFAIAILSLAMPLPALAETVDVKYRGPVPLDTFECADISHSSFIERVCYDSREQYMVIRLKSTYYHYCEIGPETIASLLAASSMGSYFNANIRGSGSDGPYDCRTHLTPIYE
jgi:KTSC domain-containing protein